MSAVIDIVAKILTKLPCISGSSSSKESLDKFSIIDNRLTKLETEINDTFSRSSVEKMIDNLRLQNETRIVSVEKVNEENKSHINDVIDMKMKMIETTNHIKLETIDENIKDMKRKQEDLHNSIVQVDRKVSVLDAMRLVKNNYCNRIERSDIGSSTVIKKPWK